MEHNETLPISIPAGSSEDAGGGGGGAGGGDETNAAGKLVLATFLRSHSCYELLPKSAKVVVFDVDIPVRLAMFALVEHDVTAAPLWDPKGEGGERKEGPRRSQTCLANCKLRFPTELPWVALTFLPACRAPLRRPPDGDGFLGDFEAHSVQSGVCALFRQQPALQRESVA